MGPPNLSSCRRPCQPIKVLGNLSAEVSDNTQVHTLPLLVVEGSGPSLLGWDWLAHLRLDWKSIHRVQEDSMNSLLCRHKALFQDGLGTMQGYEASLHVDQQAVAQVLHGSTHPVCNESQSGGGTAETSQRGHTQTGTICRLGSTHCAGTEEKWM